MKNSIHFFGFTLLELLLGLALMGIVIFMSVPSVSELRRKNLIFAEIDNIFRALQFARMTAIAKNELVEFCKSNDKQHCGDEAVLWKDGQIIVAIDEKKHEHLLQILNALSLNDILEWHSNFSQNENLGFLPSGMTNGQHGSFYYCSKDYPQYSRAIIVNENGRVYVSDKTAEGASIKCY